MSVADMYEVRLIDADAPSQSPDMHLCCPWCVFISVRLTMPPMLWVTSNTNVPMANGNTGVFQDGCADVVHTFRPVEVEVFPRDVGIMVIVIVGGFVAIQELLNICGWWAKQRRLLWHNIW